MNNSLSYAFGRKLAKSIKSNSPLLLAITASVGVVFTATLAVKATPKALKLIDNAKKEQEVDELTPKETAKATWKCYIPAASAGMLTIGCVIGSAALSKHQQMAVTGAYALLSHSYDQYKGKLKELFGEEAHQEIVNAIVKEDTKDVYLHCPGGLGPDSTLSFGDSKSAEITRTFYDEFSKRYFESTVSRVLEAEYHFNRNFVMRGDGCLNEFYEFLGLEPLDNGEELGWSVCDGLYWVDFDHHLIKLDDGMEIFSIEMVFQPQLGYEDEYEC